jgi:aminoglycoside phosphotransferase (APT) family kinase protein
VAVPEVLATGQPGEVLDVAFFVMNRVVGPVVTTLTPAPLDTPADRRAIGESLIDTLVSLHGVDWRARGLEDYGRPEGFNARHLARMARLVGSADGAPPDGFTAIDGWLRDNVPPESGATIVHNDFRIGNVILAPDPPGRVAAVLDWELATIGDPLFDVAYFLSSYPAEGEQLTPTNELGTAVLEAGNPTRDELGRRYADATGADVAGLQWYTAVVQWKLAVLYEYGRRRAVAGEGDAYYADPSHVRTFLDAAHRAAGLGPVTVA